MTHDMRLAAVECDEVVMVSGGVVVGRGTPDDLVDKTDGSVDLESAFLIRSGAEPTTQMRMDLMTHLLREEGA